MEQNQKNTNKRKKITAAVSVAMVAAILLAGTYAWVDYDQHKTSEYNLDAMNYRVTLNEDFEEINGWNITAPQVNQDITVSNTGFTDGTYGDVFVRIQLREYFEVVPVKYTFTPDRYMVAMPDGSDLTKSPFVDEINGILTQDSVPAADLAKYGKDGYDNFVTFTSAAAAQGFADALAKSRWKNVIDPNVADRVSGGISAMDDVVRDTGGKPVLDAATGLPTPVTRYYIKTAAHDPNGQYGKHIPLTVEDDGNPQVYTSRNGDTPPRAKDDTTDDAKDKHNDGTDNCLEWSRTNQDSNGDNKPCPTGRQSHSNRECGYLVHQWGRDHQGSIHDCDLDTHIYFEWGLGNDVISIDQWKTMHNSQPVAAWIVDTNSEGGWAYWGMALKPGTTTSKLTDHVTLLEKADGRAYYAIHADMEAVDLLRTTQWTQDAPPADKAPQELIDGITGGQNVAIALSPGSARVAQGGTQSFAPVITGTATQAVTWAVAGGNGNSTIADGLLTVAADEADGALLTVTATHPASGKTASATVTVDPAGTGSSAVVITNPVFQNLTLPLQGTHQFAAKVTGNSASQEVTWAISGKDVKSTITSGGLLTIDDEETANTFTVTATSKADASALASVVVTVANPKPSNVSVAITNPAAGSIELAPGGTHTFAARVSGKNVKNGVTWKLTGSGIKSTIDETTGLLTVAADEADGATFTVTATAVDDDTKTADATVTIKEPPPQPQGYPIVIENLSPYFPYKTLVPSATPYEFKAKVNNWTSTQEVEWAFNMQATGGITPSSSFTSSGTNNEVCHLTVDAGDVGRTIWLKVYSKEDPDEMNHIIFTVAANAPVVTGITINTPSADTVTINHDESLPVDVTISGTNVTDQVVWRFDEVGGDAEFYYTRSKTSSLNIPYGHEFDGKTYTVTAKPIDDENYSDSFTLIVNPATP